MASALDRKLGIAKGAVAPVFNPAYGQVPPAVPPSITAENPYVLPNVKVEPLADVRTSPEAPTEPTGWRSTVGRALLGFGRGFAATPSGISGYNPIGAGIAGGLIGTGQGYEAEQAKRDAAMRAGLEPKIAAAKVSAEEQAKMPFKHAGEQDTLNRELALTREKNRLASASALDAAKEKSQNLGIPTADYLNMRDLAGKEIRRKGILPDDPSYDIEVERRVSELSQASKAAGARGKALPPPAVQPAPAGAKPPIGSFFGGR